MMKPKMRSKPLERCMTWAIQRMHQYRRVGLRNPNTVCIYWRAYAAKHANIMWHMRTAPNGYRAIKGGEQGE